MSTDGRPIKCAELETSLSTNSNSSATDLLSSSGHEPKSSSSSKGSLSKSSTSLGSTEDDTSDEFKKPMSGRSAENGHDTVSSQSDMFPKDSQETDQSLRVTSTPFFDASQKKPGDFGSLQLSGGSSISPQTSYLYPHSKTELQNSPPPVVGKFQLTSSSSSDDDRHKKNAAAATKTPDPPIPESLQVPDWCQQVGEASEQSIADSESNTCGVQPQRASDGDGDAEQDFVMQSPFLDHHSEKKDNLSEEISMEIEDRARPEKNDSEVSVTQQSELIMTGTAVDIFNPEVEHSDCKEKEKREEDLAESQPKMFFEMSQDFSQQQVAIGNYMIKQNVHDDQSADVAKKKDTSSDTNTDGT